MKRKFKAADPVGFVVDVTLSDSTGFTTVIICDDEDCVVLRTKQLRKITEEVEQFEKVPQVSALEYHLLADALGKCRPSLDRRCLGCVEMRRWEDD